MTDEAKRLVEHLRKGEISQAMAFDASCLIVYLDAALEHTKRERDAAIDDLSAYRPCDACGYYELQGDDCIRCRKYTKRPRWKWRGVKEEV